DPRYDNLKVSEVREIPIKCGEWIDYGYCRYKHFNIFLETSYVKYKNIFQEENIGIIWPRSLRLFL
ncbi:MAG: hypothetical protein Q6363_002605, partial [Candidatus Njordarchaeota archaeon]